MVIVKFSLLWYYRNNVITFYCERLNQYPKDIALQTHLEVLYGRHCLDIREENIKRFLLSVEVKQWLFQQCSGLGGIPNSLSSAKHPFGTLFPVEVFYEACEKMFGKK